MTNEILTTDALIVAYDNGRRDFSRVKLDNGDDGEDFYKTRNPLNLDGVDLSGINLSHADLEDVDFSKATLIAANFSYADLTNTDFDGANLTGADLSYTDLCSTYLSNANCTRANLSHLDDFDTTMVGTSFVGAIFEGTSISSSDRWQIAAVLEGALYEGNPDDETVEARKRGIEYVRNSENCWTTIVTHERRYNAKALVWGLSVLRRYEDLEENVSEYNADLYVATEDTGIHCDEGAFSDLRDGDKIGIREDGYRTTDYPATVLYVLPSGVLEVESDDLDTMHFFPDGKNIDPKDNGYTLIHWTGELADQQEAEKLREQIDTTDFDDVALPALRVIVAAINGELPANDITSLDTPNLPAEQIDDSLEYNW